MKKRNLCIMFALCAAVLTGCQKAPAEVPRSSADTPNQEPATSASVEQPVTAAQPAESKTENSGRTVKPLPSAFDLSAMDDCTFSASFAASDVGLNGDGALEITMTVYDYDRFDAVDISQLAAGDTIVIDGQEIAVTDVEAAGNLVKINGGAEEDGWDLYTEEDGVYVPTVLDEGPVYHALGEVTLPVDQDFVYTDRSDPEKPEAQYPAGDFLTEMENSSKVFSQQATTVRTAGGKIVELTQAYMP